MKKISNTFELSGFIANDAQIRNFDTASVARFAISVSRAEKNQAGETAYKSALINIEAWRKNENLDSCDRLKKGEHITVTGYFKPEEWTGTDGKKNQRVVRVLVTAELAIPVTILFLSNLYSSLSQWFSSLQIVITGVMNFPS